MTIAIQTTNISKQFKDKLAVNKVNLTIKEGEIFAILGPNGAGKSTLLRMLSTLTPISSGSATIFGIDVQKKPQDIRRLIGLTGQAATVDESLSATENLVIFGRLNGLSKSKAKVRANELLEQFSLQDAAHKKLKDFSGGMRRRLDLAISLIARPKLIFLDEPTTGLDPRTRGEMWDTIRQLVANGSTLLLTTQYLEEADQLANRIAIIDQGQLIAEGSADELKATLGKGKFELSFVNSNEISKAQELIQTEFGLSATLLPEQSKISISLEDTRTMSQILNRLDQSAIALSHFATRQPTLDEVFLSVTGK